MSSKCTVCNTVVYPNDPKIVLDGCAYHKGCAKCVDCQCQITISNFTKVGTELLCRTHNLERFHKDNSYVGGDKFKHKSGSADSGSEKTATSPKPTPVVEQVREQETVFKFGEGGEGERGDTKKEEGPKKDEDAAPATRSKAASIADRAAAFGGSVLTPSPTNRPKLDSVNSASSMTSTSSTGSIKDRMSAFSSGSATSAKCPVCSKTVYPADAQITLDGTKYHKACAKCADCQCQITLSNFTKVGTELLCRTHNLERFHKDNSYVGGDKFKNSTRDLSSPSDPPKKEPEQEPEKCRVIKVEEEGKVVVEVVKVVEEVAAVKIGEHIEVDGRAVEEVKAEEVKVEE
ncbi:hypothetical protein TrVE_jg6169 [Triparma verrucosa]|uniref:LIM zinc-binding domain-containing protein n=1 Tax=Triparma verrucosa TaxID=1606542 RepID=A0A9W7BX82_9STRA|nr:hypothetical protein TrVE_jg6169 [Triparma verrucosa]